jgi:pyruvate dehydrogenase E2 component (dihydrolipoamide acetyltransferase)
LKVLQAEQPVPDATASALAVPSSSRARISPAARKHAAELGVDPASVVGTGPGGRVTTQDVERAAAAKPPSATQAEPSIDRQARMRQVIAAAMARSKREIPHYYLSTTIDMGHSMTWLAQENSKRSVPDRLLYGVLLIKSVAVALKEYPELNGFWREGQPQPSKPIHVGVAISMRGGGLVAPALHDTDQKSLDEIMKAFRDLVARARAGSLRSSELADPTITVTSLGEQGVESVFGVIYPPQVALVGFGKPLQRPWVVDNSVVIRPTLIASLSADHRASDGHRGALFLAAVDRLLQSPEKL